MRGVCDSHLSSQPIVSEGQQIMNLYLSKTAAPYLFRAILFAGLAVTVGLPQNLKAETKANIILWDTESPLETEITNRAAWRQVPSDLLSLESSPRKATGDPGYYGREYAFKGDALVETRQFAAAFGSAQGKVSIYAKDLTSPTAQVSISDSPLGRKILELAPLTAKTQPATIKRMEVVRNTTDEVELSVSFTGSGSSEVVATFAFGKTGIIEIEPTESLSGVAIWSPLAYGVAPSFVGDDLIYNPADFTNNPTLHVPADNLFLGLSRGEQTALVMTWPNGQQQLRLHLADDHGQRSIESVEFDNDRQSLFLAPLNAPGIWHKQALDTSFLEQQTNINWTRPFPAKWKTQLYEEETRTTFAFRHARNEIWRGVPGGYQYPVWFDGEQACYYLGKKVPPKGESLIYFVEGQDTPPEILTPVDVLKATLGLPMAAPILDAPGRKLRTHHRRGGEGVHRACTCGCTEAIQAVFAAKQEGNKKDYIAGALGDMIYFVHCHVERIDQYRQFAKEMIAFLQKQSEASPQLKPFFANLTQTIQRIPEEYEVQKVNMKSFDYVDDLAKKTLSLAGEKSPDNLAAYMKLLKAWRDMGGAQDYVLAQCHTITRRFYQEAGYGCAAQSDAVPLAREIRARTRQVLRNPDGYEIWPDY